MSADYQTVDSDLHADNARPRQPSNSIQVIRSKIGYNLRPKFIFPDLTDLMKFWDSFLASLAVDGKGPTTAEFLRYTELNRVSAV